MQTNYLILYLLGVFFSSLSQVLLKKAALQKHSSKLHEYLNWRVIVAYGIFFGCTLLTVLSYKGLPMNIGPVLETTGYIYVTIWGAFFFHEKITKEKVAALLVIIFGILIYSIGG